MDAGALERLHQIVLGDRDLWPPLLAVRKRGEFALAVSVLASERGLAMSAADVDAALAAARDRWLQRWG